jgi:Fe-S-cluster-containing dehydrogenase component
MILDLAACNGCYNCQVVCKDEHVANEWLPYAKPQPDTGQFWNKLHDNVRGSVPKVKITYEHSMCQMCEEAPCLDACPSKAIYRRPDGIVIIDPQKCRGNKMCMSACPYENVIFFNDSLNIAQKCTFCAHLIDQGWKDTRCADACPTGGMIFGEEEELKDLIAKAEPLRSDLKTKPRVYYLNLPKKFIAGALFDEEADACTEGATVTAVHTETGEKTVAKSDSYGDFWLNGLKNAKYTLLIEKPGYLPQKFGPVDVTEKDVNVGDIKMWKAK